ncbi:MAG: hypothetical protein M0P12_03275 [Paludibacteraceae bacterium]|nr:hypothetical protein [Paludibacteraceae bacterium]
MRTVIFVGIMILAEAICQSQGVDFKVSTFESKLFGLISGVATTMDIVDFFRTK